MNLHSEIMNIQIDEEDLRKNLPGASFAAYKVGHREARHTAAELSLKAEARIEELQEILASVLNDSGFKNLDDKLQEKIWEKM